MLFLQLNEGTVLALNAATGAQVWSHIPTSTPVCGQDGSSPKCLITSSPAIDPNRNFVYAFSRNDGKIHKYAVATGAETIDPPRWPALSSAKPNVEKGSSAITFATSSTDGETYLYMTHSSFLANDGGDYQGHITAINLRTGSQIVFNAVCSDKATNISSKSERHARLFRRVDDDGQGNPVPAGNAGIWGRAAATYDPANDSIYISTANGVYDPTNSSVTAAVSGRLGAAPAGRAEDGTAPPVDSYTPPNFDGLMRNDTDLGSASLAIIPTSMTQAFAYKHLGIQAGKDANLRIIDLDDMDLVGGPLWGAQRERTVCFRCAAEQ